MPATMTRDAVIERLNSLANPANVAGIGALWHCHRPCAGH